MVKVMPSATGVVNWKVKSLLKVCTFTGVEYHAVPASLPPPSVKRSLEPFRAAVPFSAIPVPVKPPAKPIPPATWMVIVADAMALLVSLGAAAIARTVDVELIVNPAVYFVDEVVGEELSVV